MGIDIRKELAQLRSMKKNWKWGWVLQRQADEYNAILAGIQAKGFDVGDFRIVTEDIRPVRLGGSDGRGRRSPPRWSEPRLDINILWQRLDGCLGYLESEVAGDGAVAGDATAILSSIGENFSDYVRPLTSRGRAGKRPFGIEDEYDVQDLIHAALRLHFEDVRPEEPVGSFAGKGSKVDFFLPDEGIGIEVKFVRNKGHGKEVATEINDDVPRYDERPDLTGLVAYIYDPHHHIGNSTSVIKQLETHKIKGNPISVYICN